MAEFKFGNFKGEFDALDFDFQKKIEDLSDKMGAEIGELTKNLDKIKMSDYIKGYCTAIFNFFEDLFDDEDAANKMFGESVNIKDCDDAYLCFIEARKKAYAEYQSKALSAINNKQNEKMK